MLAACATTPDPPAARPVEPGAPKTGGASADLTDVALAASGFESDTSRREARASFERLIGPVLEELARVQDDAERGRALLQLLHSKGGLLGGRYDARATTLEDVLVRRSFNCVSSAVVYNVAAERIGLEVSAELLPTHARTLLSANGRRIVVETTSPKGFDPDPNSAKEILRAVAGPQAGQDVRAIVSEGGAVTTTLVLIGAIYVNRASIAQEAGDLERAERLFGNGEAMAATAEMRQILRDQRAALMSQLAADDIISGDPERARRAYRTLKEAVKLGPKESRIKRAVYQNLRAAAERVIAAEASSGDEQRVLALAGDASVGLEPEERSGLRAFALSEVARLRLEANQFDAAVDTIDRALAEQLGAADARLRDTLEQNRVAALRLAAVTSAKAGDYAKARGYLDRVAARPIPPDTKDVLDEDRLRIVHLAGTKRIDERKFDEAVEIYRDGARRFPKDGAAQHNLVAVLERIAIPLAEAARCAEAEPHLQEIQMLDPKNGFPSKARARCLIERARERLAARDYSEAVSLLRAAKAERPGDRDVEKNLAVALVRWAGDLSGTGQCQKAKRLVEEVASFGLAEFSKASLTNVLGACKG